MFLKFHSSSIALASFTCFLKSSCFFDIIISPFTSFSDSLHLLVNVLTANNKPLHSLLRAHKGFNCLVGGIFPLIAFIGQRQPLRSFKRGDYFRKNQIFILLLGLLWFLLRPRVPQIPH